MDTATQEQLDISIKDLLEAGAHFGHQKQRWNPKMKRFIFESRDGIYIIDLAKTMQQIRRASEVVRKTVSEHKSILFVGTKKQAKAVIKELAEQVGEYYVCERWLGGMLTNLPTIRNSVKKLDRIDKRVATGGDGLTKKEMINLTKLQLKLEKNLSGVRGLRKPPGLIVVVDPSKEHLAVAEANKLGIPVIALVDTNCDPDPIQHVIACNDDALKSIKLIVSTLAKAITEQKNKMNLQLIKEGKKVQDEQDSNSAEEEATVAEASDAENNDK